MRILFSAVAAVSLASFATAQLEGWEPGPATPGIGPIPSAWTSVNVSVGGPGTNPNWQVRNDGAVFPAFSGSTYAWANYNAATGANNISNYLISPQVSIANGATISFYTRTVTSPAFPDRLDLVFNTTGSTLPADFTNVLLTVNPTLTTAGYPTTWTQYTATVSGVTGTVTGRYAFHYNPTGGGPAGANSDYIGIDEVVFTPAGGGTPASNTSLGQGCIRSFASFYELFAAGGFDLSNSSMSMLYNGTGYIVLPGITTYLAPSATATALTLGDDTQTAVTLATAFPYVGGTTTSLSVCSNGFVSVSAVGNGTGFTPNANTMLNAANTGWWMWHDFNPSIAGSGQVKFEEVGGIAYVTWDGVYSFGTTVGETFQLQFDTASGNVHFVWGTVTGGGNGYLVGYSPGGASGDPSNRDISATLPTTFTVDPSDIFPLALAGGTRPVTGTNWNLDVSNIPATGVLGVDVFGISDPGINDLFFLGAPGCGLRASLDVTSTYFVAGPTRTYSLAIPNNAALSGFNLYTTTAVFQFPAVNALGAITSNGIQGTVGTF